MLVLELLVDSEGLDLACWPDRCRFCRRRWSLGLWLRLRRRFARVECLDVDINIIIKVFSCLQVWEIKVNAFAYLTIYYSRTRAVDLCSPRALEKAEKPASLDWDFVSTTLMEPFTCTLHFALVTLCQVTFLDPVQSLKSRVPVNLLAPTRVPMYQSPCKPASLTNHDAVSRQMDKGLHNSTGKTRKPVTNWLVIKVLMLK